MSVGKKICCGASWLWIWSFVKFLAHNASPVPSVKPITIKTCNAMILQRISLVIVLSSNLICFVIVLFVGLITFDALSMSERCNKDGIKRLTKGCRQVKNGAHRRPERL